MNKHSLEHKMGDTLSAEQAMQYAVMLASHGVGFVSPNPPVGCVILSSDNKLIGYGYHERFGGPHAEVNAISSVAEESSLKGSTFIVSLEPCSHVGKTPACSDAIIKAGAAKVIYADDDPNPKVAGGGLAKFLNLNIEVEKMQLTKKLKVQLREIMTPFFYNMKTQKSFVTLKVATSLDGFIAKDTGESQWITGPEARQDVHKLRGQHDAILVGRGTVENDNPKLNIRFSDYKGKKLWVVVLDPELKLVKSTQALNIYSEHSSERIIFVHDESIKSPSNCEFQFIPILRNKEGGFDLNTLWQKLFDLYEIGSVLVEGGARTHSELLKSGSFQQLSLYMGAKILGFDSSVSWTKGLHFHSLVDSMQLQVDSVTSLGNNVLIRASLIPK